MKYKNRHILLAGAAIQFFLLIMPQLPVMFRAWQVVCFTLAFYIINSTMTYLLLKIFLSGKLRFAAQIAISLGISASFFAIVTFTCGLIFGSVTYDKETILLYISTLCICALLGRLQTAVNQKMQKEQELENLKLENMKSRYAALNNQIHPHFFFNSLNSMAALIRTDRKEESLRFCNEMSRIFRYIMQKDTQVLTTLSEEIAFIRSYLYMLTIRYCDDLECNIDIPENAMKMHLPFLSLLPLIENIAKHNIIDSRHHMLIRVCYSQGSLSVTNPVFRKNTPVVSDKIGLSNLAERYRLLTGKCIEVKENGESFCVSLPLIE